MPAFDRLAYGDDRCLGRTRADLRRLGLTLPDPAATLQPREIERLADFLFAKVIGQGPMDRAALHRLLGLRGGGLRGPAALSKPRTARPQDEMPTV